MMGFETLRKEPEKTLRAADFQRKVMEDCLLLKQTNDARSLVAAWPENATKTWMLTTLANRGIILQDKIRAHAATASRLAKKEGA